MVRIQPDFLTKLDRWSARQEDHPSRPEALRRLAEVGLRAQKASQANQQQADAAKATAEHAAIQQQLQANRERLKAERQARVAAGEQIDRLQQGHATTPDQQASRKRRLLKGPKEFRDLRAAPKAK